MRRLLSAWYGYWFAPGPLLDLAVCRIVIVGFHVGFLIWWDPLDTEFPLLARMADGLYEPLNLMRMLWGDWRPPDSFLRVLYWATLTAGATSLLGLATPLSLVCLAVGSLLLRGYAYSFGELHHPEALMVVGLFALALGPSGRMLSLDALIRRRGERPGSTPPATRELARWPLLMIRWMFALVYLSAGYHKLRAGADWLNGDTLRYYLIQDSLRWASDLGLWLAEQAPLLVALSWFTVVFEATFFLTLAFPVLAALYVPAGIALHAGIYVTMRAPFFEYLALYAVFVPWARWLEGLRAAHARRRVPAPAVVPRAIQK